MIARVETEALDSNTANNVVNAKRSFPENNINTRTFARGGTVVSVKKEA